VNGTAADGLGVFSDLTSISPVAVSEPVEAAEIPESVLNCLSNSTDTEALLRDLEAMLPLEATPPQTPPHDMLTDIDELLFLRSLSLPDPEAGVQVTYLPPTPSSTDSNINSPVCSPYASPTMLSPPHAPSTPMSQPSPMYAPSTPYAVSTPASSPYPASTTSWESDSNSDPDWTMDEQAAGPSRVKVAPPARAKPYARTGGRTKKPEDRKERKKLQNKNAATRYRIKKKAEEDVLLMQEDELISQNKELQGKVDDLANEIRIIKGLLRDHCKRLGILKK
jgi:hypothetical protein